MDKEAFDKIIKNYQFLTMQNSQHYETENVEDDSPISEHTTLNFFQITPQAQQARYSVKRGIVETDDNRIMSISGITGSEFEYFEIDRKTQVTYVPNEFTAY